MLLFTIYVSQKKGCTIFIEKNLYLKGLDVRLACQKRLL